MNDVVITWLLNATPDPQRAVTWSADLDVLRDLIQSIAGRRKLIVLSDCLPAGDADSVEIVPVAPSAVNVYFRRWQLVAQYLADRPCAGRVWCVDGSDVEMLADPFPEMEDGRFYIGSEAGLTVGCSWMRVTNPTLADWIDANADRPLLNPGLVGGAARDVERFAAQCGQPRRDLTDMGAANLIAYSAFPDHVTGSWHTPYRAFTYVEGAWWKHK